MDETLNMFDIAESRKMERAAVISRCGNYRYRLTREWDINRPRVCFVMLNPSTADANNDDPTLRRCISFAKTWGYGSLDVVNLFALRSPNPKDLKEHKSPVGPENDDWIYKASRQAFRTVIAWGACNPFPERATAVLFLVPLRVGCLGLTKQGHPRHPLYVPSVTALQDYAEARNPNLYQPIEATK